MSKEKKFAIYESVYQASKMLTDAEFVKAFRAILTYHFERELYKEPVGGTDAFKMFMTMTKPLSDSQKRSFHVLLSVLSARITRSFRDI